MWKARVAILIERSRSIPAVDSIENWCLGLFLQRSIVVEVCKDMLEGTNVIQA